MPALIVILVLDAVDDCTGGVSVASPEPGRLSLLDCIVASTVAFGMPMASVRPPRTALKS